jgi:hypothetical protein
MSAPKRDSKPIARQVADELAGTPVSKEMRVIGTKNTNRPPTTWQEAQFLLRKWKGRSHCIPEKRSEGVDARGG